MSQSILLLPGDGIGPEIMAVARRVIDELVGAGVFDVECVQADIGGAALDRHGVPLPGETLARARAADAILFGAIGGPKWDGVARELRPESGLLRLRSELGVFANLRPAVSHAPLAGSSSLRAELVAGLDLMIVRELTGGIYFGEPRGVRDGAGGARAAYNTLVYDETEIRRICVVAFELARRRSGRVCSVDKANVLEVSQLWREVANETARAYPGVSLEHMYVDNAAMQLVRAPRQFDVIVTSNLFGDILSDLAAMLTGSIGMLPSASLDAHGKGLYEPIHGSAPDLAGRDQANPLAMVLSLAMMLRHSLDRADLAERIEHAVGRVLASGMRTQDIAAPGARSVGTAEMGSAVIEALRAS